MLALICCFILTETLSFTWRQFKSITRKIISQTSSWLTRSKGIRGLSLNTNQKSTTYSDGTRTMGATLCKSKRDKAQTIQLCFASIFVFLFSIGIIPHQPKEVDQRDKSTELK
jgi:hypothetical protein